jgi:transcriptional regulator
MPAAHTAEHLDELTARFELALAPKPPWSSDRLPPKRMDMLMQAIVVIEMQVEVVEGKFKLNQHKPDADYIAVARALRGQGDPAAATIAMRMVALKPHLVYD